MATISIATAQKFVQELALPPPVSIFEAEAPSPPIFDFNAAKDQAMVVGSSIVSFVKGVTAERRGDITKSALLAQLAATKRVPDEADIFGWYNAYFDILTNIGWVIQERNFDTYYESGTNFEAHEAIVKIAEKLLDPKALAVVSATLQKLRSNAGNNPWLTLFRRMSQSARTAKFQIALANSPAAKDDLLVALMTFGLIAKSTITQTLFIRFSFSDVEMKHCSAKVSIDGTIMSSVRDIISQKIAAHAADYVRALPDL
jgi:hypothetical protein